MYDSLVNRLAKLPDDTIVYPGHLYSPEPSAPLGETKRHNPVLAPRSAGEWLALFGN
jgi:glyoxylase-like metal-dependent hydrolase (beta-lactamase superfamily II)